MLSAHTKEAIKVALALSLSILIALWLGWNKPYWAAVVVLVLAITDSRSHSLHKGYNRLFGTLLGILIAFLLLANFAQEPLLFITTFLLLAMVLVYLGGCPYYGYGFQMSLTICALIVAMGGTDPIATFTLAVLRIQENLLGIIVFSLVFTFLWPESAQSRFFQQLSQALDTNLTQIHRLRELLEGQPPETLPCAAGSYEWLQEQLKLPFGSSYILRYRPRHWQRMLDALQSATATLSQLHEQWKSGQAIEPAERARWLSQLNQLEQQLVELKTMADSGGRDLKRDTAAPGSAPTLAPAGKAPATLELLGQQLQLAIAQAAMALGQQPGDGAVHRRRMPGIDLRLNAAARLDQAVAAGLMMATALALWIFLPVPGGVIFPMLAVVFANVSVAMPRAVLRFIFTGFTLFSILSLIQYIFILPNLTEAWQLGLFYFLNILLIWRLFAAPQHLMLKLLGSQMLVVMTMGAMNLTPVYSISSSLTMMLMLLLVLFITNFFMKLLALGESAAPS